MRRWLVGLAGFASLMGAVIGSTVEVVPAGAVTDPVVQTDVGYIVSSIHLVAELRSSGAVSLHQYHCPAGPGCQAGELTAPDLGGNLEIIDLQRTGPDTPYLKVPRPAGVYLVGLAPDGSPWMTFVAAGGCSTSTGCPTRGWTPLGGHFRDIRVDGSPAEAPGCVAVRGIGTDLSVYSRVVCDGLAYGGWSWFGGRVLSLAVGYDQLHTDRIFGIGTDAALWARTATGTSFGPWTRLGGVGSMPVQPEGRNQVGVIGSDDALWVYDVVARTWGRWGGALDSLAASGPSFVGIGLDGQAWSNAGTGWTLTRTGLDGAPVSGDSTGDLAGIRSGGTTTVRIDSRWYDLT